MTGRLAALLAGHGGELSGQNGAEVGRMVEDEWALRMCRRVKHSVWPLPDVVLLRTEDTKISLSRRGELIHEADAGLAVCVHVDSRPPNSPPGAFVFHWPGNYRGETIAREILRHMPEPIRRTGDVKSAHNGWPRVRNVLHPHPADCISILLEVGDAQDAATQSYMLSEIGQYRIAHGIAAGVLYFLDQEATSIAEHGSTSTRS